MNRRRKIKTSLAVFTSFLREKKRFKKAVTALLVASLFAIVPPPPPSYAAAEEDPATAQQEKQANQQEASTDTNTEENGEEQPNRYQLTQGSLSAFTLPPVTVYGVVNRSPAFPVTTRFGTQFNVITEEQIALQNSLDFYDALRNVPGVMFQKKNIIGGQTSHSLYIRGRGASHPNPDINITFDDVPRSGVLYGQSLADGIPVYAIGGMEIYKYPQPSRFGSGYGMMNFVPKYMTKEGTEFKFGVEGGSYGTFAENFGYGVKKGDTDFYFAQSHIRTDGHVAHSAGDQSSYYFNFGRKMSEHWTMRLMGNYVKASTETPYDPANYGFFDYDSIRAEKFDTESSLFTLTFANEYEKASGYIKTYYNNTNFYLWGDSNGDRNAKQSNTLYGLRARETFQLKGNSELVAGFDLDKMDLKNEDYLRATGLGQRSWDFPDITTFSPYFALSKTYGNKDEGFHITPSVGLRYYNNSEFANKTAPQLGLVFGRGDTTFNMNYAKGVNYPSPVILQGFILNDTPLPPTVDTKNIKPEVVDHYEFGVTHALNDKTSLNATFFYDDGKDRLRAFMFGPQITSFNSSVSRYKIRGLEISSNIKPNEKLELFAGLTWLRAKARGDNGIEQERLPYTPTFALQTGFKWKYSDHVQFSGDYQYLQNVYAGTSGRTNMPGPSGGVNFGNLTSDNKLPNTNVVNLRVDYILNPEKNPDKKIFLAINNVLGAEYAYAMTSNNVPYYMPGRTFMAGYEMKI
ncbi:MAG: TonB-dependent receptor [Sporomusaceae bacterium]|jgi:iron complex outermembrane receptor protein|nr:TonB-dependent receptor [Sporomusaceae bacterium]